MFSDGWGASPIGYTFFRQGGPGTLVIDLSRTGYRGNTPPGRATIRVGTVRLDESGVPVIDRVLAVRHGRGAKRGGVTERIHVAATPVTVSIVMTTFIDADRSAAASPLSPRSRSSRIASARHPQVVPQSPGSAGADSGNQETFPGLVAYNRSPERARRASWRYRPAP